MTELQRTNEHNSLQKYTSDTLFERVDVGCVWEVSCRRGQTATYWPKVLLTIAALFSCPGWAAPSWVTEGRKPSVCKLILTLGSCPQLTPTATDCNWNSNWNWPKPSVASGYIFLFDVHLFPEGGRICHQIQPRLQVKVIFRYLRPDRPVSLFFRLFTQVHLLIDGSVEGQHITQIVKKINYCYSSLMLASIMRK